MINEKQKRFIETGLDLLEILRRGDGEMSSEQCVLLLAWLVERNEALEAEIIDLKLDSGGGYRIAALENAARSCFTCIHYDYQSATRIACLACCEDSKRTGIVRVAWLLDLQRFTDKGDCPAPSLPK